MVNSEDFIKRLEKLFHYYGLSAAAFADKISVQRSSISHLLSGRNKPSLEFVLKIIKTFPEVNLYWLLNGKGTFPSDETSPSSNLGPIAVENKKKDVKRVDLQKAIERIIIFYTDGSFKDYQENAAHE